MSFRRLLLILAVPLPSPLKVWLYRKFFKFTIGRGVRIGFSWIDVGKLTIGEGATIGHFNRFKGIPQVSIGAYTIISNANTFTSAPEFTSTRSRSERGNQPRLIIGEHCGIGLAHYFDVQDEFVIGRFSTIAGLGSAFWTHYLHIENCTQNTKPIRIGEFCMVGAGVKFVPGAGIANNTVVALGSVVTKTFEAPFVLLGGNPAKLIRLLSSESKYFSRTVGRIGLGISEP
jgi:acetyltransferase-like isoleucine patch superfamily enzyme